MSTIMAPETTTTTQPGLPKPALSWAETFLSNRKGSYLDGTFVASGKNLIDSINPANGELLCQIVETTNRELDEAVAAARSAFQAKSWRRMPRKERATILKAIAETIRRHHTELATLEALDNGKLYTEAFNDDVPEAADVFDYYAGWVDKAYAENCPVDDGFLNYTVREPLGVCALIVPWNFPLLLACWKLSVALATGNTVIVKPSPYTPLSVSYLFQVLHEEVALPPGVINLVHGGQEIGAGLSEHQGINKISFTGSTAIGREVAAGAARSNLKHVSLELGGKSPNIVFEDVPDLEFAINRSFQAMFSHKGEKCSEPTRLFVHKSLYEHFLSELEKLATATVCGAQFDPSATQGAQCNAPHFDKIMKYIEIGKAEKLRLIAGGHRDENGSNAKGLFVRPTIFADVDNKSRVAQEEIFGPVLTVTPFTSDDEVVAMANDTIYGLAAGLWTSDISRANRVAGELDAGMVFVNKYGCYDFASPFGGFKQSGWGKEMSQHSLNAFTKLKSVWVKY